MEEKPTMEEVLLAVNYLYNNPNQTEKEAASLWLDKLQKSTYAWTIADELLHLNQSLESCYFAAHTMRRKIQSCFFELPIEEHVSLRDSLINHAGRINQHTDTAIVTQLCLALAGLMLNMTSWKEPVLYLISIFSEAHSWLLLDILSVLPEELNSDSAGLGHNRRSEFENELKRCSPTVKNFLIFCWNNVSKIDDVQAKVKIIKCYTAWIHVNGIFFNDISNDIMSNVFRLLNCRKSIAGALHDTCTEFVCELTKSFTVNDYILEGFLLNNVSLLEDAFRRSTAEMNLEKSSNYCRIFVNIAITLIEEMMQKDTKYHYDNLLNLLLLCANHNYKFAEMTFDFWYLLSAESELRYSATLCDAFFPYVDRLFTAIFQHCQMEERHEGLLKETDDRREFRKAASLLINDFDFMVTTDIHWFRHLSKNVHSPEATWNVTEASLFIIQSVAKSLKPTDDEAVIPLVEALLNFPENIHIAMKHTSILLFGELNKWVDRHHAFLDPILNFLLPCLNKPELGAAAAKSLTYIFTVCKIHMTKHLPMLLELAQNLDTFSIDNQAISDLLQGITGIISYLPRNAMEKNLIEICYLQIYPLDQLMSGDFAIVKYSSTDPCFWLKRLKCIFEAIKLSLEKVHNILIMSKTVVVMEVWPTLTRVMIKYQHDFRIMDKCCTCMNAALCCVKSEVSELVKPSVTTLVGLYGTYRHSCFIYLGSVLFDHYGTNGSCIEELMKMFTNFVNLAFNLLETLNDYRLHSDTVKEFFSVCRRMLKRCPLDFLNCPEFGLIFQRALFVCSLDYQNSSKYAIMFMRKVFRTARNKPELQQRKKLFNDVFMDYGQELTTVLIRGCAFTFPCDIMEKVADVFVNMLLFNQDVSKFYIRCAMESFPNQPQNGIVKITPQQLECIYDSIVSDDAEGVKWALNNLKILHR